METMDAILTRRSIRKYLPEPVSRDMIEKILKAGMSAPSAGNEQPWHFIIIDRRDLLEKISEMHPYANMLKGAPAALLICADRNTPKFKDFWVQDCSAASENMLLAAHALGLGAVWIGVYPAEKLITDIRELFKIPEHVTPFSIISIGHPAEEKPGEPRYEASRIHDNSW
ncbi:MULTISPECIES: nitroreductase family protein [unclassified Methanosarcina]|uniref:nitroreductase family protein n=1 Tax=unclassified Methanosarcina TaxID=2644672 RepID=UPI0006158971|nr:MULTISPECIES: nitroreductase family protein [unclassified Methanosarcina]AKB18299.1 nitroreductase [Methanosarcina sp. WWM596]AKB21618.1 nitroreductase [Methanosarcina sp. WH1]